MITTESKVNVPEGSELIDEVFYVWKTRYGLHSTMTKEGRKMLTGLQKKDVVESYKQETSWSTVTSNLKVFFLSFVSW